MIVAVLYHNYNCDVFDPLVRDIATELSQWVKIDHRLVCTFKVDIADFPEFRRAAKETRAKIRVLEW